MFNKLNFKWLLIIFGSLLGIYVLTILFKSGSDSNFDSKMVSLDTAKISAIYIKNRNATDEIKIERQNSKWYIVNKSKNIKPDMQYIASMLNELANLQIERIVSSEKKDWPLYEVSDSAGTKVRIEQDGKTVADLVIGKYSFQQQQNQQYSQQQMPKISTYVRLNGEDDTYSVNGFLAMTFSGGVNQMRDKTVVNLNPEQITRVSFNYPADSSFTLTKDNNYWKIANISADSAKTITFLNTLARLYSYNILDKEAPVGKQLFSVKIEGNNFTPVQLQAFESDTIVKRIITSSMIPDVQFDGIQGELFNQIFVSKTSFLPTVTKK